MKEKMNPDLPTIGILVFEGFLTNEITAPLDVFAKKDSTGKALFNVVLVAKENKAYTSEEGLRILPDLTIDDCPELKVLVIPSSMDPSIQVNDAELVHFVQKQNQTTAYTASHCAGAFLLGEAGIANGKKVVTYCGGSDALQEKYPNLLVQDDQVARVVKDGKLISSNGNLVSYIASLELLEILTSTEHMNHVKNELLLNRLADYEYSH